MGSVSLVLLALAGSVWSEQSRAELRGLAFGAEVVDQTYCSGETEMFHLASAKITPDTITLRLTIRVSYQNVSAQPLVFAAESGLSFSTIVSKSLDDARHGQHQVIVGRFGFPVLRRSTLRWSDRSFYGTSAPLPPRFEIIQPGQSTHLMPTEENPEFQVHNPAVRGPFSELLGKKIFVQWELRDGMDPKLARYLQVKWQDYGTLWTGELRSQPIEIEIPQSPVAHHCESLTRLD